MILILDSEKCRLFVCWNCVKIIGRDQPECLECCECDAEVCRECIRGGNLKIEFRNIPCDYESPYEDIVCKECYEEIVSDST